MKLYHNPISPKCRKVLMTAELLGTTLDKQVLDLFGGDQKKPEYLRINPMGLVPTLVDGGSALWESNAIMQYLAEKKQNSALWPSDPAIRADITRWQFWEQAHWDPAISILVREYIFFKKFGKTGPDANEVKKGEEAFARVATVLNQHLDGRSYLVGDHLTLADISVAAILMFAKAARLPLEQYPNIKRWCATIVSTEAWQKTSPPPMQ